MFRKSAAPPPVNSWISAATALVKNQDGRSLVLLLRSASSALDAASVASSLLMTEKLATPQHEWLGQYLLYLQALLKDKRDPLVLEPLSACLRRVVQIYSSDESRQWMLPLVVYLLSLCRKTALSADQKWQKKLVEILREIFPQMHKERFCLPGTCWLICQLLSLFVALDQVKLCAPVLAALTQSLMREGGFNPNSVPLPIALTLYFLWAKIHIMDSRYSDAHDKLCWAFERAQKSRSRIARYLIPTMIVTGRFPRERLLHSLPVELNYYVGLSEAIKTGNLGKYNELMQMHAQSLAVSGTLLLMEQCKTLCCRNLAKRTHAAVKQLIAEGENNANQLDPSKLDICLFELAWKLARENVDTDELICAIANLMHAGYMKGYISLEHSKVVLSKTNPFPSVTLGE